MSQLGIDFANQWVAENIQPTVYAPDEGPHPEAEARSRASSSTPKMTASAGRKSRKMSETLATLFRPRSQTQPTRNSIGSKTRTDTVQTIAGAILNL